MLFVLLKLILFLLVIYMRLFVLGIDEALGIGFGMRFYSMVLD